jgi:hypothetical protein
MRARSSIPSPTLAKTRVVGGNLSEFNGVDAHPPIDACALRAAPPYDI